MKSQNGVFKHHFAKNDGYVYCMVDLNSIEQKLTVLRQDLLRFNRDDYDRYMNILYACINDVDVLALNLGFNLDEHVVEPGPILASAAGLVWNAIDQIELLLRDNDINKYKLQSVKTEIKMARKTLEVYRNIN